MRLFNKKFKQGFFYKTLFLVFLLSFSLTSFSDSACSKEDEANVKRLLKEQPNTYMFLTAKAKCFLSKGNKEQALYYLDLAKKNKGVYPAYLVAEYFETDGDFKPVEDPIKASKLIDQAINSYQEVITLIGRIPDYPPESEISYIIYEIKYHIQMNVVSSIPRLYFSRFSYQFMDHYSDLVKRSPGFNSSPETSAEALRIFSLPAVAHYMGPLYSLNKMEESANYCINTPYIEYWDKKKYDKHIAFCQLFKNFVNQIRPLEDRRIQMSKSCKNFITNETEDCEEYQRVSKEIWNKILSGKKEFFKIMEDYNKQ